MQAGYPAKNGIRFHIMMKTSTEESTRLLAAVLQQQLREVGIALDIRSYEFATFLQRRHQGCIPDVLLALDRRQPGSRHFRLRLLDSEFRAQARQSHVLLQSARR